VVAVHAVDEAEESYTVEQINQGLFQKGNISLDPMFTDFQAGDYRLIPESPLIDASVDVGNLFVVMLRISGLWKPARRIEFIRRVSISPRSYCELHPWYLRGD